MKNNESYYNKIISIGFLMFITLSCILILAGCDSGWSIAGWEVK